MPVEPSVGRLACLMRVDIEGSPRSSQVRRHVVPVCKSVGIAFVGPGSPEPAHNTCYHQLELSGLAAQLWMQLSAASVACVGIAEGEQALSSIYAGAGGR